jgi:hypothetical protein
MHHEVSEWNKSSERPISIFSANAKMIEIVRILHASCAACTRRFCQRGDVAVVNSLARSNQQRTNQWQNCAGNQCNPSALPDTGIEIMCLFPNECKLSHNSSCQQHEKRDALNRRAKATMTLILELRRSKQNRRVPFCKINTNLVRKADTLNRCAICNACNVYQIDPNSDERTLLVP